MEDDLKKNENGRRLKKNKKNKDDLKIFYIFFIFLGHLPFFWGGYSSFSKKKLGRLPFFLFFLRSSSIFFWCRLSSWVKIRLHTHYKVKLQLMLRLSWAVTIWHPWHQSNTMTSITVIKATALSGNIAIKKSPAPEWDPGSHAHVYGY